jgi:two-component system, NarL family, sensor histidine kinase UhpB
MQERRKKILLVEDNPSDVWLVQQHLELEARGRFEVHLVENLQDALDRLSNDWFDVVLLDLYLPDASGLTAVLSIHRDHPQAPIVVLTGYFDPRTTQYALDMGACEYFSKRQVDWKELAGILHGINDPRVARPIVDKKRQSFG